MKTAVVTGAAQGVGRAVARTLAQSGYRVVLTDLQVLDDVVDSLRSEGAQAVGRSGDIRADGFADALADWVHEQFGAVDVLVNNAGISLIAPALETTAAQCMAARLFMPTEPRLNEAAIREGLRTVCWPGRFEIVPGEPVVVIDGAHNPDGARTLRTALDDYFPGR
ncbi:MAG TPA: SDR family NAD(P)-dependent oxidoreductase, partial [Dokdonella sp.]